LNYKKQEVMARFSRIQVVVKMIETGLIPIFNNADLSTSKKIVKACYDGGVRVIEYTNRGDFAQEVFTELNKFVIKELPDMILGIGTVVDGPTAALFIQSGANFIVSPYLKEDLAIICNRRKILWIPGCGSLTEISKAEELGAEIIKIFPALQVGGPKFVSNIKGPCPWTSLMPAGGVEPQDNNLKEWFESGVTCVGMGSQLITKEILEKENFEQLALKCKESLNFIKKYKKS
jgi:2-dehydro-3-deoxyphosphogluconate aldolase / (4S)-4-hydroxy-2-oxoglutarate aldolase